MLHCGVSHEQLLLILDNMNPSPFLSSSLGCGGREFPQLFLVAVGWVDGSVLLNVVNAEIDFCMLKTNSLYSSMFSI